MKFLLKVFACVGCWAIAYALVKVGLDVNVSYWIMGGWAVALCSEVSSLKI